MPLNPITSLRWVSWQMNRNRFALFREITNIFGVVECLDVYANGNSHAIQQFKEIEVERIEDYSGSSFGRQAD